MPPRNYRKRSCVCCSTVQVGLRLVGSMHGWETLVRLFRYCIKQHRGNSSCAKQLICTLLVCLLLLRLSCCPVASLAAFPCSLSRH
jgi:hypothetical protein